MKTPNSREIPQMIGPTLGITEHQSLHQIVLYPNRLKYPNFSVDNRVELIYQQMLKQYQHFEIVRMVYWYKIAHDKR